jgi:hypothetical protein
MSICLSLKKWSVISLCAIQYETVIQVEIQLPIHNPYKLD